MQPLPIFAHIFSVSEFGLIELILTIAGLIGIFLNLGLNNAVQRFYFDPGVPEKDRPSIVSSGLWILCGWSILFTLAVCTISFILNDTLLTKYEIPLSLLLIALLTNIPSQILQYCLDVLRLHFAPVAYSCLSILKNISGIILQLLLVVPFSLGVFGYFFGAFIALILIIPVGFWVIKKDLHLAFERSYGEILIAYGYPFVFAGMAYWIFGTIDRLMLTGMTDLTQVGLYSIAFKFSTILTFVNSAFGQAWSPYVIKLYREEINYRQIISQIFFNLVLQPHCNRTWSHFFLQGVVDNHNAPGILACCINTRDVNYWSDSSWHNSNYCIWDIDREENIHSLVDSLDNSRAQHWI